MNKKTQAVILCEDQQQEVFLRSFLVFKGIHRRKIRINRSPKGKQSGEQYVRNHYVDEVKAFRRKNSHLSGILLVVIDADNKTVEHRVHQLEQTLQQNDISYRTSQEKIILVVPKRNIETWIYYLMGKDINESDSFPKLEKPGLCKTWVKKITDLKSLPQKVPDSLKYFWKELSRLD